MTSSPWYEKQLRTYPACLWCLHYHGCKEAHKRISQNREQCWLYEPIPLLEIR